MTRTWLIRIIWLTRSSRLIVDPFVLSSHRAPVDGVPEHARQRARFAAGGYHKPLLRRRGKRPPPRGGPRGPPTRRPAPGCRRGGRRAARGRPPPRAPPAPHPTPAPTL